MTSPLTEIFNETGRRLEGGELIGFSLVTVDRNGMVNSTHSSGPIALSLLGALEVAKDRLIALFSHGDSVQQTFPPATTSLE